MKTPSTPLNRRRFLGGAAAATATVPFQILGAKKTDSPPIIGEGAHRYEVLHDWAKLPDQYTWQTTHNVAVDPDNNLYVIHEGKPTHTDHPSIFVFDSDGKFIWLHEDGGTASDFGTHVEVAGTRVIFGGSYQVSGYTEIGGVNPITYGGEDIFILGRDLNGAWFEGMMKG